jgi:hypothetical protein
VLGVGWAMEVKGGRGVRIASRIHMDLAGHADPSIRDLQREAGLLHIVHCLQVAAVRMTVQCQCHYSVITVSVQVKCEYSVSTVSVKCQ